ncbi:MAG: hypothetical protein LBU39_02495 [Desulfobulbaceae bacterium]|nr:hypothetical protein [Desulfobulbaceae bacterium]
MWQQGWWKYGLWLGAGIVVGAAATMLVSKNSAGIRKGAARVLSHGINLKDKACEVMATAKENLDDIAAEARHENELRKGETGEAA